MKEKEEEVFRINVEQGEFPFPIIDGPVESRYLTWLRNNANYMAVRGFLDYLRAIGVLLRGILINFAVMLPFAFVVAFAVAAWYMSATPYLLTIPVLIFSLGVVLLYPLITPLYNIWRHKRRLETGSDSSVGPRSLLERLFGALLLSVLGVVTIESLVAFLEPFHNLVYNSELDEKVLLSLMSVAALIFASTDKLLAVLAGLARKLAIIFIGALGVLVPLFFILLVSDYLVFNPPKWSEDTENAALVLPLIVILMTFLTWFMLFFGWITSLFGDRSNAFTLKDVAKSFLLCVAVCVATFYLIVEVIENGEKNNAFECKLYSSLALMQNPSNESSCDAQSEDSSFYGFLKSWYVREQVGTDEPKNVTEDLQRVYQDVGKQPYPPKMEYLFNRLGNIREPVDEEYIGFSTDPGEWGRRLEALHPHMPASLLVLLKATDMSTLAETLVGISHEETEALRDWFDTTDGSWVSNHVFGLGDDLDAAYRELAVKAIYSKNEYPHIFNSLEAKLVRYRSFTINAALLLMFAIPLWVITRLTVDVNLTSIHGLYRDRLASAFLVGADTRGDVDIEKDLDLGEICRHEAGSTAPYHLINVALNMQGSKLLGIRDRQSDFFVFSKKFIGGFRTRYCRSETMELLFPQMGLSTAMAISAAAASPNMGRATSPALVVIMTLFNIRLGYWLPNPKHLESWLHKKKGAGGKANGYSFDEVFAEELDEVTRRWEQLTDHPERHLSDSKEPTTKHALVGIGFSGGGIRSATLNLGIVQELHRQGVFDHIDYMSTVSGGGYLGSSISALMRQKTKTESEVSGVVDVSVNDTGKIVVSVSQSKGLWPFSRRSQEDEKPRQYEFASYATLAVKHGDRIKKNRRLLNSDEVVDSKNRSFGDYYDWRVRPTALLKEIAGKLDESHRWVNVSDGGHIENLAGIELLRRRCKYIVIGDGEADPEHHFNGLAILIQTARIDLGIHIDIKVKPLRLNKKGLSKAHWVVGRISYPDEDEKGYLLYLKSSVTGDEDVVIKRYRNTQPTFPHESTADQFFGEGQFEAYRSLGQHIGESLFETAVKDSQPEAPGQPSEQAAKDAESSNSHKKMSFTDFEQWFEVLASKQKS